MQGKRVLFCLEQQYGHINPTLGIAMELLRRGCQVSYAVLESFVPLILAIGATPLVIDIVENRDLLLSTFYNENDHLTIKVRPEELEDAIEITTRERFDGYKAQLERLYRNGKPDLVIRDEIVDRVGREFAATKGVPSILLRSQFVNGGLNDVDAGEKLTIVTVPRFFQRSDERNPIPPRFKFVGFIPEGRTLAFRPWGAVSGSGPRVLISPTTGMRRQTEFCRKMVEGFRDRSWEVVLSISASHDTSSAMGDLALGFEGKNVRVNTTSANFDVLSSVDLYICQGGQGSTLEAIYRGVPQIVVPPTPYHYFVGNRVRELGLGSCIPPSELSVDALVEHSSKLLADEDTRARLIEAQKIMWTDRGAEVAANLIEDFL